MEICNEKGFEVAFGTVLKDPFRSEVFDFALSIAVIHHLRTPSRRLQAIKEMLRVMRSGALGLIFVWAFEENKSVRRHKGLKIIDGNEQDVLVPWSMNEFSGVKEPETKRVKQSENLDEPETKEETKEEIEKEGNNARTKTKTKTNAMTNTIINDQSEINSFQRYYHLFIKGELDYLVLEAGGKILESGYDRDNWYIKFQK